MPELVCNTVVLRKRLRRLLRHRKKWSEFSTILLPQLKELGSLALIGGAVRDVARDGVKNFNSDLDFVLYDGDAHAFRALMHSLEAKPNRFGGFSLRCYRWRVDIWALEDTWARTAGLRQVNRLSDLLDCTFFDWDAILFNLGTGAVLTKPTYFTAVEARVLDVNLQQNPNPTGSLIRAIRRGALWKVRFGATLSAFVRRQLDRESWDALVALDASAFPYPVLRYCDPTRLRKQLETELVVGQRTVTEPFGPLQPQLELPLA